LLHSIHLLFNKSQLATEWLLVLKMVQDGTSLMYFDHNLRLIQTLFILTNTGPLITIHLPIPEELPNTELSKQLMQVINLDYLSLNCQDSAKELSPLTKDVSLLMMKVKLNVNNNKITFSVFAPTGLLIHSRRNNSTS